MACGPSVKKLDRLTEDELRTLCVGETNGMAAVERERKISVDTVRFLDSAFAIMLTAMAKFITTERKLALGEQSGVPRGTRRTVVICRWKHRLT